MTDSAGRQGIFAQAAECLRSLSQYRTSAARAVVSGPASESMAVKLLELANKLDATDGAGLRVKFSASDRAVLMEALSAMEPLVDRPQTSDVSPREMIEREHCAGRLRSVIELLREPQP